MINADIGMFLSSLNYGGAERVVVNLSKGFSERGLKVDIVLSKEKGGLLNEVPNSVNIVSLDAPNLPLYKHWGALPSLIQYFRTRPPKYMIATTPPRNLIAIVANKLAGSPSRVFVREGNDLLKTLDHKRMWRVYPPLMKYLYPKSDGVIAISQGVADSLEEGADIKPNDVQVIYNPAVTPDLFELAKEPVAHPWFRTSQPPVIIGVGSLRPQKDFETLITAFDLLLEDTDARLVILGEGSERAKLERLANDLGIANKVDLLGYKENPFKYMKNASVFALSSKWEGFANVLVESMACKTPIVSTDCPSGPREVLQEGEFGSLVPVGDAEKMARKVKRQLKSPTPEEKLYERAQDFHYRAICQEYFELMYE